MAISQVTARQAREMQQNWLIENLMEDAVKASAGIVEAGEKEKELKFYRFCWLAAHDIAASLIDETGGAFCSHLGADRQELTAVVKWIGEAKKKINGFSVTKEEESMIKVLLQEKLMKKGTELITFAYVTQATEESMRLFGTRRFNDMVPMPTRGD